MIDKIDEITILLVRAQENLQNQQIKTAIEEFEKVLKLDPECFPAKQGLEQAKQEEIIEVKTGTIFLCEDCGKALRESIKVIKVKRKEASNYEISKIYQGLCSFCRADRRKKELISEIVEYARKFREVERKKYNMQYELQYKTPSSEMYIKAAELGKFAQYEYAPVVQKFGYFLNKYISKYGVMALRDLAIEYNFLDLLYLLR